jgi:hypothetical protein
MARDDWLRDYEGGCVHEVELECVRCAHTWLTDFYREYGSWWLVDDDAAYCDECGGDGEE